MSVHAAAVRRAAYLACWSLAAGWRRDARLFVLDLVVL